MDPRTLLLWLAGPDLESSDGHCLSWSNYARTGYSYPEASGLLLHLLSLAATKFSRRERLCRALTGERPLGGAIRRGSQSYTFDTAMVLGGVLAHVDATARVDMASSGGRAGSGVAAGDADELLRAVRSWAALLVHAALLRSPTGRQPSASRLTADTRWSMAFGAHQAKVCGALLDAARLLGTLPGLDEAVEACAAAALDVQTSDGRFRIHAASPVTYVHSHCYAVEGLLLRAAAGSGGIPEEVVAAAQWLAAVQQPDGSIRAWHDGSVASGPSRADATAQAVRIWTLVDRGRFAVEAARACAFLSRVSVPAQGLRYEHGSDDVNACATMFAVQALSWRADPAAADTAQIV